MASRGFQQSVRKHINGKDEALSRQPLDLYSTLREMTQNDPVIQASAEILRASTDPFELAKCAELISGRLPGGPFFRARLWGKVGHLVAPNGFLNGSCERFAEVCMHTSISLGAAKQQVLLGEAIRDLEAAGQSLSGLHTADAQVFTHAAGQRKHATTYLLFANHLLREQPSLTSRSIHLHWCKQYGSRQDNLDIIKPSDWWAFSRPKWRRDPHFPGSIPGEIYANALYYFSPREGIAVDAMAGSGMLCRVYQDRSLWQKDSAFKLRLYLFDLEPRYRFIRRHDAKEPLPVSADWVFVDPPYFGQSEYLYSGSLAEAENYNEYLAELSKVIRAMAYSLAGGGRLCLLLPKWSGKSPEDRNHDAPGDACRLAQQYHGLQWIDSAYVSRARQQEKGFGYQNIAAKKARRMISDTCILNVFERS